MIDVRKQIPNPWYLALQNANNISSTNPVASMADLNVDDIPTEVTHAGLLTLIDTSTLQPGKHYKITDFQTIYPQPDYSAATTPKTAGAWTIKTGNTEPLVVLATSINTISKEAWSINFPYDVIEYDYRVETYNETNTKGKITRRRDEVGNDISFDFRNVQFKRYETVSASGVFDSHWDTGFASAEFYALAGYTPLVTDDRNDPASYQYIYQNNIVRTINRSEDGYFTNSEVFGIWAFNTILKSELVGVTNNTFEGLIENNTLTNPRNNTFDGVISNNIFYQDVYENKFEGIILGNKFLGTVFGNSVNTSYFSTCTFQEFKNNFIQGGLSDINATDTNTFAGNTVNQAANLATVTITGGADFSSNEFLGTSAGGGVTWETPFLNNSFYGIFTGTSVASNFNNNIIKGQFNSMTNILTGFAFNTISSVFTPTDFATATHVYGAYDCEIFRRQDGTERLKYIDNTDAVVVTNVNA